MNNTLGADLADMHWKPIIKNQLFLGNLIKSLYTSTKNIL